MLEYINSIISINIDQNKISKSVAETAFKKLQNLEERKDLLKLEKENSLEKEKLVNGKKSLIPN